MFQKQVGESLFFQRPFLQISVKCQPALLLVNIVCLPLWAPLLNTAHKALGDWTFVSVPVFVLLHSQPVSLCSLKWWIFHRRSPTHPHRSVPLCLSYAVPLNYMILSSDVIWSENLPGVFSLKLSPSPPSSIYLKSFSLYWADYTVIAFACVFFLTGLWVLWCLVFVAPRPSTGKDT